MTYSQFLKACWAAMPDAAPRARLRELEDEQGFVFTLTGRQVRVEAETPRHVRAYCIGKTSTLYNHDKPFLMDAGGVDRVVTMLRWLMDPVTDYDV